MRPLRLLAGWLCIAIGFVLMVVFGLGALEPTGAAAAAEASALTPVVAMLPRVSIGIAVVAAGVWLITTRNSK